MMRDERSQAIEKALADLLNAAPSLSTARESVFSPTELAHYQRALSAARAALAAQAEETERCESPGTRLNEVLKAIRSLGGNGSVKAITARIPKDEGRSEAAHQKLIRGCLSYLRAKGRIVSIKRGQWQIAPAAAPSPEEPAALPDGGGNTIQRLLEIPTELARKAIVRVCVVEGGDPSAGVRYELDATWAEKFWATLDLLDAKAPRVAAGSADTRTEGDK